MQMKKSKYILYLSFAVVILMSFFFSSVPFFWDGTFFSEIAIGFYEGKYGAFDFPENLDNVTFPFYSTYLFFAWTIFSKSLLVSHLAMLPFLLGICYEFYKLAGRFLNDRLVSFAMILLLLEPTFMTQGIIMGYDIILVYLFLLAVNLMLNDKQKFYSIIIPIIALYSIRGLFLALSLSAIQFMFLYPEHKLKSFLIVLKHHIFCIILVIAWFSYHKIKTGWFIISPIHENTDEQLLLFSMMVRQAFFIAWKAADFGRIVLWLVIISGSIIAFKKRQDQPELRALLIIIFIPLVISSLLMIPFSNPIGHRYFMFSFITLIIGACYILQEMFSVKKQTLLIFTFFISMATGNFWLYPERFGNGWDASLKVIPYFQLKEQMDGYIIQNKISPFEVGTQYPLIADKRLSHLSETSFAYTNVWRGPLSNYSYYLQSNVINTDISEQTEEVKKTWILVNKLEAGQVYISLYQNPEK
jgi:hypothetical protein